MQLSSQRGYACLVQAFEPFNPESRDEILRLVTQKCVDGFIFTPPCDNDQVFLRQLEIKHRLWERPYSE
jgi:DNA-binding LacI/PurR family transcriptional regulator